MHHKRKRPRNRRAGCKLCKPWKVNGFRTERKDGERFSDHRKRHAAPAEDQSRIMPKKKRSYNKNPCR